MDEKKKAHEDEKKAKVAEANREFEEAKALLEKECGIKKKPRKSKKPDEQQVTWK